MRTKDTVREKERFDPLWIILIPTFRKNSNALWDTKLHGGPRGNEWAMVANPTPYLCLSPHPFRSLSHLKATYREGFFSSIMDKAVCFERTTTKKGRLIGPSNNGYIYSCIKGLSMRGVRHLFL